MHINTQTLHNFLAQKLSVQEQKRIEAHLATCRSCSEHFVMLRRSFANETSSPLVRPPAALVQRSIAAFRKFQSQQAERVKVVAHCPMQGEGQAQPGLRAVAHENQMLYTTDHYDIDIRRSFDESTNSFALHGQILPHEDQFTELSGFEVHLIKMKQIQRSRITNALGEFTFSYIPEGSYSLLIALIAEDVVVNAIVVKQKPLQ